MEAGSIFGPYVDPSEPTPKEFARLRRGISDAITEGMDEDTLSKIKDYRRSGGELFNVCRYADLDPVLNRTRQNLSRYETGNAPIPQEIMHLLRLLHKRITANPEPAREVLRRSLKERRGQVLTPEEAGGLLGVKKDRVWRLIRGGDIQAQKVDRRWEIDTLQFLEDYKERVTMSTTEAAEVKGCTPNEIRARIEGGIIEAFKIGGQWRVTKVPFLMAHAEAVEKGEA